MSSRLQKISDDIESLKGELQNNPKYREVIGNLDDIDLHVRREKTRFEAAERGLVHDGKIYVRWKGKRKTELPPSETLRFGVFLFQHYKLDDTFSINDLLEVTGVEQFKGYRRSYYPPNANLSYKLQMLFARGILQKRRIVHSSGPISSSGYNEYQFTRAGYKLIENHMKSEKQL